MRSLYLLLLCFAAACSNPMGSEGSITRSLLSNGETAEKDRQERAKAAQFYCAQQGYSGESLHACIQKSVNQ